jgi:hypothetical protein
MVDWKVPLPALAAVLLLMASAPQVGAQAATPIGIEPAVLPTSHAFTSAIWNGTHAFIFGGQQGSTHHNHVHRYDPATGTMTTMGALMPSGRSYTAAVFDGVRYAYVFGGYLGGAGSLPSSGTNQILRYDTVLDVFAVMSATLPTNSWGYSAIYDGTNAYIYGGNFCTGTFASAAPCPIVRYTPGGSVTTLSATLPNARYVTAAIYDGTNAYVFGGLRPFVGTFLTDVIRHDIAAGTAAVVAALPAGRPSLAAAYDGTTAYVIGGVVGASATTSILTFDPTTATVGTYARVLPAATSAHSAVWGPTGFVFAGGTTVDRVYCFECLPIADFDCTSAPAPWFDLQINFKDLSRARVGSLATWTYAFGDGTSGGGPDAIHIYSAAGTYTVSLQVTDGAGRTASVTKACTAIPNLPPLFVPKTPQYVLAGNVLSFSVHAVDPEGYPVSITATTLPAGSSFDSGSARFYWPTSEADIGGHVLVVQARELVPSVGGKTTTMTVPIAVLPRGTVPESLEDRDGDGVLDIFDDCAIFNPGQEGSPDIGDACVPRVPQGVKTPTPLLRHPVVVEEIADQPEPEPCTDVAPRGLGAYAQGRTWVLNWTAPPCPASWLIWSGEGTWLVQALPSMAGPALYAGVTQTGTLTVQGLAPDAPIAYDPENALSIELDAFEPVEAPVAPRVQEPVAFVPEAPAAEAPAPTDHAPAAKVPMPLWLLIAAIAVALLRRR